jgi:hypothetical protein
MFRLSAQCRANRRTGSRASTSSESARSRMMQDRVRLWAAVPGRWVDPQTFAVRAWRRPESASACEGSQQA